LKKKGTPARGAGGGEAPLDVLARAAQRSGGAAREQFARRARERVVAAVREEISSRLANLAGFDDVVQDVMLRITRGLADLNVRDEVSIHGWILTLVRNRLRDLYDFYECTRMRDPERQISLSDLRSEEQGGDQPDALTTGPRSLLETLNERELIARAVAAIGLLPPNEALAVRRIELDGELASAIAKELGVHEATVRIWLGRGLARIAEKIGEEFSERKRKGDDGG
jgi:RNA polymerase sigma factor (sigma-70 family)